MGKISQLVGFSGKKIEKGMTFNITKIEIKEIPGFGNAVTLFQEDEAFGTFAKAIVSKATILLKEIGHDSSGNLEEIIPVKVVEKLSKDRRPYLDLEDREE